MLTFDLPNGTQATLPEQESVMRIVEKQPRATDIYAVIIDQKLHDLRYVPNTSGAMQFVSADSEVGKMIYERTLTFVFIAAVHHLFEHTSVSIAHALSSGHYCEITRKPFLTPHDVTLIQETMKEMIANQEVIQRTVMKNEAAVQHFEALGMRNKAELLKCRKSERSSVYSLCGCEDYFYGILLPHAGYIKHFSIRYYAPGVWLSPYDRFVDQRKMFTVFQQFETWGKAIGVSNVAELNRRIEQGGMDELVLMCETMMEKQLTELAALIVKEKPQTRCILIAGPSSAGKTTFSKRLAIHLKILGMDPLAISMDNFYKNREDTPKLPDGSYDFDGVDAIDLPLFHDTMMRLMHHQPVFMPRFNFKTGLQERETQETQLSDRQILIMEGIHGLNPRMSEELPQESVFKIYINALTHLNLDEHNRITTSDYRLIRRIARDYQTRGWDAQSTISFWRNVKQGEEQNIYPYQEGADAIFNTSMVYELAVLKRLTVPLLREVKKDSPYYLEAHRLERMLAYFADGSSDAIPRYSILAEFLGNSILDVS